MDDISRYKDVAVILKYVAALSICLFCYFRYWSLKPDISITCFFTTVTTDILNSLKISYFSKNLFVDFSSDVLNGIPHVSDSANTS